MDTITVKDVENKIEQINLGKEFFLTQDEQIILYLYNQNQLLKENTPKTN